MRCRKKFKMRSRLVLIESLFSHDFNEIKQSILTKHVSPFRETMVAKISVFQTFQQVVENILMNSSLPFCSYLINFNLIRWNSSCRICYPFVNRQKRALELLQSVLNLWALKIKKSNLTTSQNLSNHLITQCMLLLNVHKLVHRQPAPYSFAFNVLAFQNFKKIIAKMLCGVQQKKTQPVKATTIFHVTQFSNCIYQKHKPLILTVHFKTFNAHLSSYYPFFCII